MTNDHARALITDYLEALETFAPVERLRALLHEDVEQIEFPNLLTKSGQTRGLDQLLAGHEAGEGLLKQQRYELQSIVVAGERAAIEVTWTATLAVPLGNLAAGASMEAHFAVFFEFRDGKIFRQRNYDCFEPF